MVGRKGKMSPGLLHRPTATTRARLRQIVIVLVPGLAAIISAPILNPMPLVEIHSIHYLLFPLKTNAKCDEQTLVFGWARG